MKQKRIVYYEISILILIILCLLLVFGFRETLFAQYKFNINSSWEKYEPCNELEIDALKLNNGIVVGKTTKNGPIVIWTDNQLDEDAQNIIVESLYGVPGVGNIKNVEFIYGDGSYSNGMRVSMSESKVILDSPSSWALLFYNNYNLVEEEAKKEVENKNILDPLPEKKEDKPKEEIVEPLPEQEDILNPSIEEKKEVVVDPLPKEEVIIEEVLKDDSIKKDINKQEDKYTRPHTGID